ncbi:MAG: MFS transporter [Desulfomonile tiedjei]|nr:MFS transporter [Desulfomonile tiedjei]
MKGKNKAILAVVCSSIATFWYGAFIFGFPGVMSNDWQAKLQVGRGEIGNILFFVLASVGILMFFVGKWQERVGITRMMTVGAAVCGVNLIFIAYASQLWMLYVWAFLMGAGSCFVYIPALTTVQRWFPTRRGLVSGIVNFTFGFSAAVMSPVFHYLLDAVGYVSMNLLLGFVALVSGLVAARFTEPPSNPAVAGNVQGAAAQGFAEDLERSLTVPEALRTASFWFLWATWALQGAAGIGMVVLSTAYGGSKGFGLDAAVAILVGFNATNGVSRLLTGYISDLFGRTSTMSATFFAAGLSYLLLPHVSGLTVLIALAAVIGFAFGALFAVSAPLAMDCFGIKHFGAIFGLTFTAYGFVAGPIGPSLSGYLLDATNGDFFVVFTYLGVFCLISSVLIRFVVPRPSPD